MRSADPALDAPGQDRLADLKKFVIVQLFTDYFLNSRPFGYMNFMGQMLKSVVMKTHSVDFFWQPIDVDTYG